MSISITKTPQSLAFSGCRNIFQVTSSNHVVAGLKARLAFKIDTSRSTPGEIVTLQIDSHAITYLFDSATSPISNPAIGPAYRFTTAQELYNRIRDTYYLSGYAISGQSESINVIHPVIEAVDPGYHILTISSSHGMVTVEGIPSNGRDSQRIANYRVAARFQVQGVGYTPWCYFQPVGNLTTVDTSMLAPYLPTDPSPAISDEFGLCEIDSPFVSYRLQVAEIYGEEPVVQAQVTSNWFRLMRGEVSQPMADELLPDWGDYKRDVSIEGRPVVFGSDNGRFVQIFRNQLDYLYLCSLGVDSIVEATVDVYSATSTPTTSTYSLNLTATTFYALPIHPETMGATDTTTAIRLSIKTDQGEFVFSRTYLVQQAAPRTAQIYIADKYGLLRSLVARSMQRAVGFEADSLLVSRVRTQSVTKREETYTIYTFPLTYLDASALSDALTFDTLYVQNGNALYRAHANPSTITAYTTERNLSTLTFEIFVESHQVHPLPFGVPGAFKVLSSDDSELALLSDTDDTGSTDATDTTDTADVDE